MLLHGQTEFIEKYGEVIDELRGRGFTVATFDWRGQGGSTRALPDPLKCHVGNFREYDEDLATFLEQVIKPMGVAPPLALAHSMGAHILLRTLHDRPRAFSAAVLSAPMMAVSTRGQPAWVATLATSVDERDRAVECVGDGHGGPRSVEAALRGQSGDVGPAPLASQSQALVTSKPEIAIGRTDLGLAESRQRIDGARALARICRGDRNAGARLRRRQGPHRADESCSSDSPGACRAGPISSSRTPSTRS